MALSGILGKAVTVGLKVALAVAGLSRVIPQARLSPPVPGLPVSLLEPQAVFASKMAKNGHFLTGLPILALA
jgi:hypothetical protein